MDLVVSYKMMNDFVMKLEFLTVPLARIIIIIQEQKGSQTNTRKLYIEEYHALTSIVCIEAFWPGQPVQGPGQKTIHLQRIINTTYILRILPTLTKLRGFFSLSSKNSDNLTMSVCLSGCLFVCTIYILKEQL